MSGDPSTVAHLRHPDVAPWKRERFERSLLRRAEVTAVFHGTRTLEVAFRCDRDEAVGVLDDVAVATRFPVDQVSWSPAGAQPP